MAIYRGLGGSVEGITEADILSIAISQGGTGAQTAAGARTNLGLGTAATTAASDYATAAQGTLADSAVQPEDIGTAAAQDVGYFATAAQGTLADSATQPGDLATVATSGSYDDLDDKPTIPTGLDSLTDVVITSATNGQGLQFNGTNWVNSSAGSGTVSSVDMTVPTGLSVSGNPVTTTGTLAVSLTSGYAIPTTAKQTEWDTAYGWGNHSSAGYAADSAVVHNTGTETVAGAKTFSTSVTSPIITASTKFVSAYFDASGSGGGALRNASGASQLQWGGGGGNNVTLDVAINLNPANAQVDISPTGTGTVRINPATLSSMNNVTIGGTTAAAITGTTITATTYAGGNVSNWNTAYGWGNHASAGYLTSSSTLDASKLSGTIDGGTY